MAIADLFTFGVGPGDGTEQLFLLGLTPTDAGIDTTLRARLRAVFPDQSGVTPGGSQGTLTSAEAACARRLVQADGSGAADLLEDDVRRLERLLPDVSFAWDGTALSAAASARLLAVVQ